MSPYGYGGGGYFPPFAYHPHIYGGGYGGLGGGYGGFGGGYGGYNPYRPNYGMMGGYRPYFRPNFRMQDLSEENDSSESKSVSAAQTRTNLLDKDQNGGGGVKSRTALTTAPGKLLIF